MQAGTPFKAFRTSEDAVLVVSFEEFHGQSRLDIRRYWQPEGGDEYVPTKKGVSIPEEQVPDFLAAVVNVVERVNEDWLDDIR